MLTSVIIKHNYLYPAYTQGKPSGESSTTNHFNYLKSDLNYPKSVNVTTYTFTAGLALDSLLALSLPLVVGVVIATSL